MYFASGNAAIDPRSTVPLVPIPVINNVLKMYLESGTSKPSIIFFRSKKLLRVGLSTVSLGGKINISLNGLNALTNMYHSGKSENNPKAPSNIVRKTSPPRLLFLRFIFLVLRKATIPFLLFPDSSLNALLILFSNSSKNLLDQDVA